MEKGLLNSTYSSLRAASSRSPSPYSNTLLLAQVHFPNVSVRMKINSYFLPFLLKKLVMLYILFYNLLISLNICHFEILSTHKELLAHVFIAVECSSIGLRQNLFSWLFI